MTRDPNDEEYYDLPELTDTILLNAIRNCTKLTSIVLHSCDFFTDRVLNVIPGGPFLRHLNIAKCWNFDESSLIKLLQVCPEISFLCLAGCPQITNKTILAINRFLLNLKTLDISECNKIQGIVNIPSLKRLIMVFISR